MKNKNMDIYDVISENNKKLKSMALIGKPLNKLSYLPYPQIYNILHQETVLNQYLGNAKKSVIEHLNRNEIIISSIPDLYKLNNPEINRFLCLMGSFIQKKELTTPNQINQKAREDIEKILIKYRYSINNGRLFEISPALSKALIETDIEGKCPSMYLRLPFDNIYIHYGINHHFSIEDTQSNNYLEGAYLSMISATKHSSFIRDNKRVLKAASINPKKVKFALEIVFIFSKINKNGLVDSKERYLPIIIDDEDCCVEDLVNKHYSIWKTDLLNFYDNVSLIQHIAKTLLFINTKKRNEYYEKNEGDKQDVYRYSMKKYQFRKQQIQALNKYNRILINSGYKELEDEMTSIVEQEKSKSVKTHWRRGHFRELPPNPPGRLKSKLVWIKPTLVNKAKNNDMSDTRYKATV